MDEKQLNYEFMSILGESHPGLTFEEYRDSCLFLLFYQYLCLRYKEKIEDSYKLNAMVRLAMRGKLQMPSFIRFMEQASPFLYMACGQFRLTEFSFYKKLVQMQSLEKQKSYARFFRKLIKKIDAWDCDSLLLERFPELFENILTEFARAKKDTHVSKSLLRLFQMFFQNSAPAPQKLFLPDFQYGTLLKSMTKNRESAEIYGYEENIVYIEMMTMLCYMRNIPLEQLHLFEKESWKAASNMRESFDAISIFKPEGVEPGTFLSDYSGPDAVKEIIRSKSKGEFPFLLSAFALLAKEGVMAALLPSALLYREGKEMQIRKYLVEDLNCLDVVMLLPDHLFHSTGQNEVLLFFKKNRQQEEVMFFDCSEVENFDEEQLKTIEAAWREKRTIPGFCTKVDRNLMRQNEFNLNLPRYITHSVKNSKIDLEARRQRIREIDRELEEIEKRIAMYKRDLEL